MAKGTVAWQQKPPEASDNESKLSAEFVGELVLSHWPSQQATIDGSFLTADGSYYTVDLHDPEIHPHSATLPTLLKGAVACTPQGPKGVTTATHFFSKVESEM